MKTSLTTRQGAAILKRLDAPLEALGKRYPGDSGARQPVHTVYGGAHLFNADLAEKFGRLARRVLDGYGANFISFAQAIELPGVENLPESEERLSELRIALEHDPDSIRKSQPAFWLCSMVYKRMLAKLIDEPVEDFRIDFEDGFGTRPDGEEDAVAVRAAHEVARGMAEDLLPPFIGIRIKPLNAECSKRSVRTLDLFLTALLERTGGQLPPHFVVTLPKITLPEQVAALADLFDQLESKRRLEPGSLDIELMVETPQSLIGLDGRAALPDLVAAGRGRVVGAHFGVYDYTANLSITAEHQHMTHQACDMARHLMQISLAGSGVFLSDGATNVLPVAPHRAPEDGPPLSLEQQLENRTTVHQAWRLHYQHVRHSLIHAFYQGWDLHPAQLPTRYAAVYAFFLENLESVTERLRTFVDRAAQASLVGHVFDDAATGQGLLNFFLRGLNCGALSEAEALETGLSLEELHSRSFSKIIAGRR